MVETQTKKMTENSTMVEMEAMPKPANVVSECAIIGLIKNYIIEQKIKLKDAKEEFADAVRMDDNWTERNNKDKVCSVIEGKIDILEDLQNDFECMFAPNDMLK